MLRIYLINLTGLSMLMKFEIIFLALWQTLISFTKLFSDDETNHKKD